MSFPQGCAFRATAGFVADSPNDYRILGASTAYPTTSSQGNTVGWESATGTLDSRDRSSSIDVRLAGINFVPNSSSFQPIFRIDLPAPGNYNIRVAFGDNSAGQTVYASVLDTSSGLWFQSGTAVSAGHFIDAGGNDRTAAAWPGSNTLWPLTFTTTICRIKLGGGGVGANSSVVAYFYIESAAAAASNGLSITPFAKPGVGTNPARVGRQFAFMGSTVLTRRGVKAVGSSGGFGGGIGTPGAGSAG